MRVHHRDNGLKHFATDVFKIDVDPLGAGVLQRGAQGFRVVISAVVDAFVKAKVVLGHGAFVRAARNADDAQPVRLGDLADHRADRTRCRRDDECFTLLRATIFHQTLPAGKSGHAQNTKRRGDRHLIRIDLAQLVRWQHAVGGPAQHPERMIAGFEVGAVGGDDLPDRTALHRAADRHRGRIGFRVVHAATHIGVKRHVFHTDQHFAVAGGGHGPFFKAEVIGGRGPVRARRKHNSFHLVGHFAFLLSNVSGTLYGNRRQARQPRAPRCVRCRCPLGKCGMGAYTHGLIHQRTRKYGWQCKSKHHDQGGPPGGARVGQGFP